MYLHTYHISTGDPWRDATVSSQFHTRISTDTQPIVLSDGFHCSDLSTAAAAVDATIKVVQEAALAKMMEWLSEWKPKAGAGLGKRTNREVEGEGEVTKEERAGLELESELERRADEAITKPVNAWLRGSVIIS